jgi:dolichol-phosphate mannosyltransferase
MDDGSTDGSMETLRGTRAQILSNEKNQGIGSAMRRVLFYARDKGYAVSVIMAGNNKDDPTQIPRLVEPILKDGFDFVQGSRYLKGGDHGNMPLYRRLATQFVHPILFSIITRRRITDSTNGFRAFRLKLLDDERINIQQEWLNKYELEPYLFFKAIRLGYKVKEVPVTKIYPPRALGYTKMKPITGWWSILRPLFYLGLGLRK